jgi:hypothetical protein
MEISLFDNFDSLFCHYSRHFLCNNTRIDREQYELKMKSLIDKKFGWCESHFKTIFWNPLVRKCMNEADWIPNAQIYDNVTDTYLKRVRYILYEEWLYLLTLNQSNLDQNERLTRHEFDILSKSLMPLDITGPWTSFIRRKTTLKKFIKFEMKMHKRSELDGFWPGEDALIITIERKYIFDD